MTTTDATVASENIQDCANKLYDELQRRIASVEDENERLRTEIRGVEGENVRLKAEVRELVDGKASASYYRHLEMENAATSESVAGNGDPSREAEPPVNVDIGDADADQQHDAPVGTEPLAGQSDLSGEGMDYDSFERSARLKRQLADVAGNGAQFAGDIQRLIADVESQNARLVRQNDVWDERDRKHIAEIDQLRKDLDAARNNGDNVWQAKWLEAVGAANRGLVWSFVSRKWVEREANADDKGNAA